MKIRLAYIVLTTSILMTSLLPGYSFFGRDKKEESAEATEINVTTVKVFGIPKKQTTVFIPLQFNSDIATIKLVDLQKLKRENIVAVISMAGGKLHAGIGLLKLDPAGIPKNIEFKLVFKPKRNATLNIKPIEFAPISVLPSKGGRLSENVSAFVDLQKEYEVKEIEGSSRLDLKRNKLAINIKRKEQVAESVFIPVFYDGNIVDLKASKDFLMIGQGVKIKTFNSFINGAAGVELVLSKKADKELSVELDLAPVAIGKTKISIAYPQSIRTNLIKGPVVEFDPSSIIVFRKPEIE